MDIVVQIMCGRFDVGRGAGKFIVLQHCVTGNSGFFAAVPLQFFRLAVRTMYLAAFFLGRGAVTNRTIEFFRHEKAVTGSLATFFFYLGTR